jgi:tRNA-Thr(GGU) m(6)t(6)A37 methyltransferase TsaA
MTTFKTIGIVHTPFAEPAGMPIQPTGAEGVPGTVWVFETYRAGLRDLDGFSHVILLYFFHSSPGYKLEVVPFLDSRSRGLFATRAPSRPNPIGLSVVRLNKVENGVLHVQDVDMLDGTPLLDIKPYVPAFDSHPEARAGWLEETRKQAKETRADDRFS